MENPAIKIWIQRTKIMYYPSMSSIDTQSTDMEEPEGRLDVRVKPSAVLR